MFNRFKRYVGRVLGPLRVFEGEVSDSTVSIVSPQDTSLAPVGRWWEDMTHAPCLDCIADIKAVWVGSDTNKPHLRNSWNITVSHNPTCPIKREIDRKRAEQESENG